MTRMINSCFIALLLLALASGPVVADLPPEFDDGWHTWQVEETDASSAMCCFSWKHGKVSQNGCNLDGRNMSFSKDGDCAAAAGKLQVYAQLKSGRPVRIHVLSSNCPVSSTTQIKDLGQVTAADNLAWFRDVIENRELGRKAREEALFALVLTGTDAAYDYLDRLLSHR